MRTVIKTPGYGTTRQMQGFLFQKKTVSYTDVAGNRVEDTRWLEHAEWEEKLTKGRHGDFWKPIKWLDI